MIVPIDLVPYTCYNLKEKVNSKSVVDFVQN